MKFTTKLQVAPTVQNMWNFESTFLYTTFEMCCLGTGGRVLLQNLTVAHLQIPHLLWPPYLLHSLPQAAALISVHCRFSTSQHGNHQHPLQTLYPVPWQSPVCLLQTFHLTPWQSPLPSAGHFTLCHDCHQCPLQIFCLVS
jgi:hypothetical protein